jgi:methylated-DNA-[protein]-cysteine S-methyltransferase
MTPPGFELFETAIGRCAIAWSAEGIVGLALPEHDDRSLRARMQRRRPGLKEDAAPSEVRDAIAGIQRLLAGEKRDLSAVVLDMTDIPEFDRRVYEEARSISPGNTVTYGDIANRLGDAALARAVGQSLGRNPIPIIVPCHRVLAAQGRLGGFSAPGGTSTKRRLLEIEGARDLHPTLPWDVES